MPASPAPEPHQRHTAQTNPLREPPPLRPRPAGTAPLAPLADADEATGWACASVTAGLRRGSSVVIAIAKPGLPPAMLRCVRHEGGVDLVREEGDHPIAMSANDVLILGDPSGDDEHLLAMGCAAIRRGALTVAVIGDRPSLLAAQAAIAVRVPGTPPDPGAVISAIRRLVRAAGEALAEGSPGPPPWRRVGLF